MKKILLLLMVMSMSACAVTDKPESGNDNGGGSTTDYNQLWKNRVANKSAGISRFDRNANLTYEWETYTFVSSAKVGRGIYKKGSLFYGVIASENFTTTLSMTKTGVSSSSVIDWADVKNITTATPEPEPDYNQLWKDRVINKTAGVSSFDNSANLTYLTETYTFDSSLEVGRGIYKKDNLYYGVLADEDFTTTLSMTKTGVSSSSVIDWSDVKNITTSTPDPTPDPDAGKKRFIANLRNLGSLYTGDSDVNIGDNGAVSYIYTASVTPITYTYYLKEVLNDTQAIYTLKSIATGGYDYFTHQVFSIEDDAIWSYTPTNTTYSLALVKLGGINSGNQDRYNELATLAYDSKHIVPNDPKTSYRSFYKRDNSPLTDINTLNLNSRYNVQYTFIDYTMSGSTINWDRYITNSVEVTVSPDKNTITYTKPQVSSNPSIPPSISRVLTFYKMQGSEAIYTAPISSDSPLRKAYYAITIRNNVLYMGFKGDLELDLKQRGLGYWLY